MNLDGSILRGILQHVSGKGLGAYFHLASVGSSHPDRAKLPAPLQRSTIELTEAKTPRLLGVNPSGLEAREWSVLLEPVTPVRLPRGVLYLRREWQARMELWPATGRAPKKGDR